MSYETYIVVVGQRGGRRYAERHPLQIDLAHARGLLEDLSDMAVRDAINDLQAEQQRRNAAAQRLHDVAEACGDYDPFASQHRGGHE